MKTPRLQNAGAALVLALAFTARAACAEAPSSSRGPILFWIRAGELAPQEVDPNPETTPTLYEMVLKGVTAPELLTEAVPKGGAGDPSEIARLLFDDSVHTRIEKQVGARVPVVGQGTQEAKPVIRRGNPRLLMEKRFGSPPPIQESEEEAIRQIFQVLGKEPPKSRKHRVISQEKPVGSRASKLENMLEPDSRETAELAISNLDKGAQLVIALEPVQNPQGARERDLVLQHIAGWILNQDAILMVLTVRNLPKDGTAHISGSEGMETGESRATLFIVGAGVRSGRIMSNPRPLIAARETVLKILGIPPLNPGEVIHALEW